MAIPRTCLLYTSYCWADEDIGSNVGEAVYKNGEMIDANIPEPGSREAVSYTHLDVYKRQTQQEQAGAVDEDVLGFLRALQEGDEIT